MKQKGTVPFCFTGGDALRALSSLGEAPEVGAVFDTPSSPPDLPAGSLVLARVADAGNVGSSVRTAAALGLPPGAAVLLGSERDGLTPGERACCDLEVSVPAAGFESLNAAAAAAIPAYAVTKRRTLR